LENIRDWNISRQIVWGIQIPAWACARCHEWTVTNGEEPQECSKCSSKELVRDQDVFDTWFSSGQWPYATLKTTNALEFYPTTVMETGYDILRWWVARMVMLGMYIQKKNGAGKIEKQIPFQNIVLHGLVNDPLGKKMSKSKGNVVNPMEIVDQYGADSIRFALAYGTALGNDQVLSYPKLEAMRKFCNKLWNMARFIEYSVGSLRTNRRGQFCHKLLNGARIGQKKFRYWLMRQRNIWIIMVLTSQLKNFMSLRGINLRIFT